MLKKQVIITTSQNQYKQYELENIINIKKIDRKIITARYFKK